MLPFLCWNSFDKIFDRANCSLHICLVEQEEALKSPPPIRSRNRGNSTYGIARKAPLFVTNPDKERSGSGDS